MRVIILSLKYIIFLLIISIKLNSQNIKGIWSGYFIINDKLISNENNIKNRFNFEIQINQSNKNRLNGVTYSYQTKKYYGKAKFDGFIINSKNPLVQINEHAIFEINKETNTDVCQMFCKLTYLNLNNQETLQGSFTSFNQTTKKTCYSGKVYLKKVTESVFPLEPFLKPLKNKKVNEIIIFKPKLPIDTVYIIPDNHNESFGLKQDNVDTLKFDNEFIHEILEIRNNVLFGKVFIQDNDCEIDIYDNGVIDNDTVSVYINNKLVISNKRISESPIEINLDLSKHNRYEILTVAENMGDILPNTALIVIKNKFTRFEIPVVADSTKNAKIIIEKGSSNYIQVERY